jgi:hypothetical protein
LKIVPIVLSAVLVSIMTGAVCGDEVVPRVIVYSSDMPNLSEAIAHALSESMDGDLDFSVVTEPSLLSSYLGMPDTACVILATTRSIELQELIEELLAYFELGGALIGFQGALNQQSVRDLARAVFPAFGNATGSYTTKEGTPVNEYSRSGVLEGFEDLPDDFDLVGQFFIYCADSSKGVLEPDAAGRKTVLFRDKKTGAPLVLAYENDEGSRSVGFSGLFVREQASATNYYGKLIDSPVFLDLLESSLTWTLGGSTRYSRFGPNLGELMEAERVRIEELRKISAKEESSTRSRRLVILAVLWTSGVLGVGVLVYFAFVREPARRE